MSPIARLLRGGYSGGMVHTFNVMFVAAFFGAACALWLAFVLRWLNEFPTVDDISARGWLAFLAPLVLVVLAFVGIIGEAY